MNANTCACGQFSNSLKNTALRVVGIACAAIGAIGLFLPLIPGTPFLLLSVLCFNAIDE